MLNRIFKKPEKPVPEIIEPPLNFGHYSDNNKPVKKVDKWNEADALFKEKKYADSIALFFNYLRDEEQDNIVHKKDGQTGTFNIFQGTKVIRGTYTEKAVRAEVTLASMPVASVPVMRRLLEMNFALYYSHYALQQDKLIMIFESDIKTANPSKLYYGLKELATKADKQDDLLVQDFTTLQPVDVDHIEEIPEAEKEVKYTYTQRWIKETLDLINTVDNEKFSGGIAYLLLSLACRIDFLVVPHGKLQQELEKIVSIYFRKDGRLVIEKNHEMMDCFSKFATRTKAEFYPYLFNSKYTFSINNPQSYKTIADTIYNANQNVRWYKDNKHPQIAAKISEYGFSYCQYSYSLPRPVTLLFQLFMQVNYPSFFSELGFTELYNKENNQFNADVISAKIKSIEKTWKGKYPDLNFKTDKLKFDNLVAFNQSFTTEVELLNL
jgi:hypothetical protein